MRSFVEPASRIPAPLRQWSQAAGALETTAFAPFFDRDVSGMRGRKVQGTNTVSKRPGIKGQQSGRARQLAFDAVPPR